MVGFVSGEIGVKAEEFVLSLALYILGEEVVMS